MIDEKTVTLGTMSEERQERANAMSDAMAHSHGGGSWNRWSMLFSRHLMTDGVKAVCKAGECYWLADAIASHHAAVRKASRVDSRLADIQFWTLRREPGDEPGQQNRAVLECRADSGCDPVVRQVIEYTDFPFDEMRIWVQTCWLDEDLCAWLLLLPSEY